MGYLVVACKECGAPRVAEQGRQTTSCHRCGTRIQLEKALVHARVDALEQAQDIVGQVNAGRADGELLRPEPERSQAADPIDRALRDARAVSGQASKVRQAAKGLCDELGSFTRETWVDALARLDIEQPRALEHLERLVHANIVAQPSHGVFRFVG